MNEQLTQKFRQEYGKVWESQTMQNFLIKQLSNGVQLENGLLIEFENPDIKENFCFSAGQNGEATPEEWNNANEMASLARTSEKYFISENMKSFKDLEKVLNADKVYLERYHEHGYLDVGAISDELPSQDCWRINFIELTKKDIENLKDVIAEEKTKFMKRLDAYLKKYGLSKVKSWTYLSD